MKNTPWSAAEGSPKIPLCESLEHTNIPPYTGKRDFADMSKDPERRDVLLDYLGGPMSVLLRGRQEGQRERDLEKLRAGFGEEEEATSHRIR